MASPQIENGYTKIANELLEVIYSTNFNATQLKIILCVVRSTYGFNKKHHNISISYLSKTTGISRRYISSELSQLIESKVIDVIQDHTVKSSRVIGLNKNYKEWEGYRTILLLNNTSTGEHDFNTTGEHDFNTTGEQSFIQKRNNKESIKKEDYKSIYDYYISLNLINHRAYTDGMVKAIKKAIKDNKYDIEYCKTLLDRHKEVVEKTKELPYPVKARGIAEFFGQKVWGATHLICSEYEEGGKYYEQYIKAKEEPKDKPTEPYVPKIKYFEL